ncbi:MAG: methionine adenosyltransferase [Alphaproteobacteria bacterium]|nr:methionine adenosyltransferase [Alphaproteobacteria bacterium]
MSRKDYLFTSESVSEGHPDKICDYISDTIVDAFLAADPESRIAVETLATTNKVVLAGEVRSKNAPTHAQMEQLARDAVKKIGYEQDGFHWQDLDIEVLVHAQSADIAQGVDSGDDKEEGAGDQGIMFGYAVDETESLMPAPIHYSHAILRSLAEARYAGKAPGLRPDMKTQLTVRYKDGKPVGVETLVLSTQHEEGLSQADVTAIVMPYIKAALPDGWINEKTETFINPTGQFIIGGPDGDAGLTGRKIIVDTYGGSAPHGGGAFSGKDPTKVDRSAAYAARYLAKNVVAAGLATRCTIQLSYAIGVAKPLSVYVDTHGTSDVDSAKLEVAVTEVMDLSPKGIRTHLELNKPIYARTAAYGHFGREPEADGGFSWEKTDLVDALKAAVK